MNSLRMFVFAAAVMLITLQSQTASAAPVNLQVGGPWVRFNWNEVPGPTFTFVDPPGDIFEDGYVVTATERIFLNVTDAFLPGDSFNVFINGVLALSTPSVTPTNSPNIADPNLAFTNAAFSRGQLTLSPGTYNITVNVRQGTTSGGAFIQATPTPEPATMLLLGTGLAGIAASARRRRRRNRDRREGS